MTDQVSNIGVRLTLEDNFTAPLKEATTALGTFQQQAKRASSGAGQMKAGGAAGGAYTAAGPNAAQNLSGVNVSLTVNQANLNALRAQIIKGLGTIPITVSAKMAQGQAKAVMAGMITETVGTRSGAAHEVESTVRRNLPQRAAGGPVESRRPVIVGERRPEVFVPHTAGRIEHDLAAYRRREAELASLEYQIQRRRARLERERMLDLEEAKLAGSTNIHGTVGEGPWHYRRGGRVRGYGGKFGARPGSVRGWHDYQNMLWGESIGDPGWAFHATDMLPEIRGAYRSTYGTGIYPNSPVYGGGRGSFWSDIPLTAYRDASLLRTRLGSGFTGAFGGWHGQPNNEYYTTDRTVPRSALQYWGDDNYWHRFRRGRARARGGITSRYPFANIDNIIQREARLARDFAGPPASAIPPAWLFQQIGPQGKAGMIWNNMMRGPEGLYQVPKAMRAYASQFIPPSSDTAMLPPIPAIPWTQSRRTSEEVARMMTLGRFMPRRPRPMGAGSRTVWSSDEPPGTMTFEVNGVNTPFYGTQAEIMEEIRLLASQGAEIRPPRRIFEQIGPTDIRSSMRSFRARPKRQGGGPVHALFGIKAIRSLPQLEEYAAKHSGRYSRWTPDIKADMQPGAHSSTLGTRQPEIGISAASMPYSIMGKPVDPAMLIDPSYDLGPAYGDFAYRSHKGRSAAAWPGSLPFRHRSLWIVSGKRIGYGVDGEPLLEPTSIKPRAIVSRKAVDEFWMKRFGYNRMAGGPVHARQGIFRAVPPDDFFAAINAASQVVHGGRRVGETVHVYSPEEYAAMRTYLAKDRLTGYAIKGEGDLVSVFNVGQRGMGKSAVRSAIQRGAMTLDAFDEFGTYLQMPAGNLKRFMEKRSLPGFYSKFGFRETGREPWNPEYAPEGWTGGTPDIVYMARRVQKLMKRGMGGLAHAQGGLANAISEYRRFSDMAAANPLSRFGGNIWYPGRRRAMLEEAKQRGWLDRSSFATFRRSAENILAVPGLASPGVSDAIAVKWSHAILDAIAASGPAGRGQEEAFVRALQARTPGLGVGYGYGNFAKAAAVASGHIWPPPFGISPKVEPFYHALRGREHELVADVHHLMAGNYDPNGPASKVLKIVRQKQVVGYKPTALREEMLAASAQVQAEYAELWPTMRRWQAAIWGEHFPFGGKPQPIEAAYQNLIVPKGWRRRLPPGWKLGPRGLLEPRALGGVVHPMQGFLSSVFQTAADWAKDPFMAMMAYQSMAGDKQQGRKRGGPVDWRAPLRRGDVPRNLKAAALDAYEHYSTRALQLGPGASDRTMLDMFTAATNLGIDPQELLTWAKTRFSVLSNLELKESHPVGQSIEGMLEKVLPRVMKEPGFATRAMMNRRAVFPRYDKPEWAFNNPLDLASNAARVYGWPATPEHFLGSPLEQSFRPSRYVEEFWKSFQPELTLGKSHQPGMIGDPGEFDLTGRSMSKRQLLANLLGATGSPYKVVDPTDIVTPSGPRMTLEHWGWSKNATGGPAPLKGLYIVGEIGPELFVPKRLSHLIPKKVMDQIPKAADGMQVIGKKRNELFAPPEDGIIVPNRLMDQIPHAARGTAGEGYTFEPEGIRGPFGRYVAGRDIEGGVEADPAWMNAQYSVASPGGGSRGLAGLDVPTFMRQMSAAVEEGVTGASDQMSAAVEDGVTNAGDVGLPSLPQAGPPPEGYGQIPTYQGRAIRYPLAIAASVQSAFGARPPKEAEETFKVEHGLFPGATLEGPSSEEYVAAEKERAAAIKARAAAAAEAEAQQRRESKMTISNRLADMRAESTAWQQVMSGRTPRGLVALLSSMGLGGRRQMFAAQYQYRQQERELRKMEAEIPEGEAGTATLGAYEKYVDLRAEEMGATVGRRQEIYREIEALRRANPEVVKITDQFDKVRATGQKLIPSTGNVIKNLGVIIGATSAYGIAMQAANAVIQPAVDGTIKAGQKQADQWMGWMSTANAVTNTLAKQTTAMNGNVQAAMSQTAATAGLSGSMLSFVAGALQATTLTKAGAAAQGETMDLLRATTYTQTQGAPAGLYGGTGGILGTALLASELGGTKGFMENVQGTFSGITPGGGGVGGGIEELVQSAISGANYAGSPRQQAYYDYLAGQTGMATPGQVGAITAAGGAIGGGIGLLASFATGGAAAPLIPILGAVGATVAGGLATGPLAPTAEKTPRPLLEPDFGRTPLQIKAVENGLEDLTDAAARQATNLEASGQKSLKVTWESAKTWEEIDAAVQAATAAGDQYSANLAIESGIVMKVADATGKLVITQDKLIHQQAIAQTAAGKTVVAADVWAGGMVRQIRAQQQMAALQGARQRELQIPYGIYQQILQQPLLPPGTGVIPGAGAGAGNIGGTGASRGVQTLVSGWVDQQRSAQEQINAIAADGLARMRTDIRNSLGAGALSDFNKWNQAAQNASSAIAEIQKKVGDLQAAASSLEWSNSIRIAKRSLGDALGMAGLGGAKTSAGAVMATNLGKMERASHFLEVSATRLSLALQERQITTQRALAGFQAPGETGEERYMRQKQALAEAAIAERKLTISEKEFGLSQKIWIENANRAAEDARKAIEVMQASRNASVATAEAEQAIAAEAKVMAANMANMDTLVQQAQSNWQTVTSAAVSGISQFAGGLDTGVKAIYKALGYTMSVGRQGQTIFTAGTGPSEGMPTVVLGNLSAGTGRNPNPKNTRGPQAAGFLGDVNVPTSMIVGEAGPETVAILRNPRMASLGGGGGGSSPTNVNININGPVVRGEQDISALAQAVAAEVERTLSRKGQMLGLRAPAY